MPVATLQVLHSIVTPDDTITALPSTDLQFNTQIFKGFAAGHWQPLYTCVQGQTPVIPFETTQLDTVLDACGISADDLSAGNTDLHYKTVTEFGTRGSSGDRYRLSNAMLIWNSLTAEHNGEARISCQVLASYDGTNEPIVPAGSTAVAGTSATGSYWGAGPVTLIGSALNGVQSISLDLGIEIISRGGESELWPTFLAVRRINPRITITTTTPANTIYGLDGTALSSTNVVYLRKYAADGTRVANGTAEHISIVPNGGIVHVTGTPAGGNDEATSTVVIECRAANAASDALTIDTTAAIS